MVKELGKREREGKKTYPLQGRFGGGGVGGVH